MAKWNRDIVVDKPISLIQAIELLERTGEGVLLFCEGGRLIGILTDPDLRRLLIKGISLSEEARHHINRDFLSWKEGERDGNPITFLCQKRIRHLPVVNAEGRLLDLVTLDRYEFDGVRNPVVLMAGGLGTRLLPYTENCPKPLLELNGRPILERILDKFMQSGFMDFYISVNYRGEMVEEKFGDGSKFGCHISYLREKVQLGTAGALSLLPKRPTMPFIVANGDVLTNVDLMHLIDYHHSHESVATMCVRTYEIQVPFGVVDIKDGKINTIAEKPVEHYYVNAGIYCLNPDVLNLVTKGRRLDMPELFERVKTQGGECYAFPIHEEWMDVGSKEDLKTARKKY